MLDPGGLDDARATAADPVRLRACFDAPHPLTVGLEEEILLVDRRSWMPAPVAERVVAAAGDASVKRELPACQIELVTDPAPDVDSAIAQLARARRQAAAACADAVAPVAAAVHPLVCGPVALGDTERARSFESEYREVARRQLVGALQVHVAVGGADSTLAVYNALRGYLPEIAALAGAAPFHEGRDSGLASVRPLTSTLLPRQGVPPAIASWEAHAEEMRWGATTRWVADPGRWWWELRPHVRYGTLEVRVPDVQPTLAGAAGLAGFVHALIGHLAARHHDGEALGAPPTWRIEENRWSALRDGTHGNLADLVSGDLTPTARRLHELIDRVEAHAASGLDEAHALVEDSAADRLRAVGIEQSIPWLAEVFRP
ncbi:MAG: YbdK family carboxylate-amine ligase [Acidimicrobiales bacterium]|nr:YbdK family carboxylate-amine ligase [Acidimicrobiales bacterium]